MSKETAHQLAYQFAYHFGLSAVVTLKLYGPSNLMAEALQEEITEEMKVNLLRRIVIECELLLVNGPVEVKV